MNPTIRFETRADDSPGFARELLCTIWPLEDLDGQLSIGDPVLSDRPVLFGSLLHDDGNSRLELPRSGAYLVEIAYPDGNTWRTTILVDEGEEYRMIMPSRTRGNESAPDSASRVKLVPRVLAAARKKLPFQEPDLEVSAITQPHPVALGEPLRDFTANLDAPDLFSERLISELHADVAIVKGLPSVRVSTFRHGYRRRWLVISGGAKHQTIVSYPIGWTETDGEVFRLSLRRKTTEGREAKNWSVALKLTDPVYGTLVEHLTRRDLPSSMKISESLRGQATTALYEKEENPFAAAAAAYLFALGTGDLEYRREWMSNLTQRYEWLPDGAIALAWKLMREGRRDSNSWQESREMLILACSRGLPYYTVGLHLLVEALTVFSMSFPADKTIQDLLAAARAADVACVRAEPFTTLQVSRFLGLPTQ